MAYSYNPKDETDAVEDPFAYGNQFSIASAMQARNSARFTVLGSTEMLENKWFDASVKSGSKQSKTGNQDFAKKLSAWTFQEVGVLKVGSLTHFLNQGDNKGVVNETAIGASELNPKIYKIKDDVVCISSLLTTRVSIRTIDELMLTPTLDILHRTI